MRVAATLASVALVASLAGVFYLRAPDGPTDCQDSGQADGVYVPLLSELAGRPRCRQESEAARTGRLTLQIACGAAGATSLLTLIALLLRHKRPVGEPPIDPGFPRT